MSQKFVRWMSCVVCVLALSGCGSPTTDETATEEPLKEWFQRKHADTTISHGDVLPDTVQQEGNVVTFKTSDGTVLRQEYRRSSDNGYERIGDPVKLEPTANGQYTGN